MRLRALRLVLVSPTMSFRSFFSRRWRRTVRIAGIVIALAMVPLTAGLYLAVAIGSVAMGGGDAPLLSLLVLLLMFELVIPALFALMVATIIEWRLRGQSRRGGPLWWVGTIALASLPLAAVVGWIAFDIAREEREFEAFQVHQLRTIRRMREPLGKSDSLGFCSDPITRVVDGRPEIRIAVRTPKPGSYHVAANGSGWTSGSVGGSADLQLRAEVETVTVVLSQSGPTAPDWPVRIRTLSIEGPGKDEVLDLRVSDSDSLLIVRRGDSE